MKRVNRNLILVIMMAIILTIFIPGGILMTVFGAIKNQSVTLALGIIMTVLGFFGAPIVWTTTIPEVRQLQIICRLIQDKDIITLEDLQRKTGYSEKLILNKLRRLITKLYIENYNFSDDYKILFKDNIDIEQLVRLYPNFRTNVAYEKCDNCGALIAVINHAGTCPYCQNIQTKNKIKDTVF